LSDNSAQRKSSPSLKKKKGKEERKESRDNTETNEMMEPEVAHVSKHPF
jgi:hypothetical protein